MPLTNEQKKILIELENNVLKAGVDGGELTTDAIEKLREKENEFGVLRAAPKIWVEYDNEIWIWDYIKEQWQIDLEKSGGPPSMFNPIPREPPFKIKLTP